MSTKSSSFIVNSTRGGMPWEIQFNGTETVSDLLAAFGKCVEGENTLSLTIAATAIQGFASPPAKATGEERLKAFQSLSREDQALIEAVETATSAAKQAQTRLEALAKDLAKERVASLPQLERWMVRCTATR